MEGVQKEMWLSCCVFTSRAIVKLQWDLCDYQTLAFSLTSWSLLTRGPSQRFIVVFNTINRDTRRKKITRKKWLYGMLFFFPPDRSLGSMSCSHSYIRIVWLILNVSACPFLRPVTAGLCLKLLLKLKHCQMEQPSNKPNLSPQLTYCPDKVLDGKVYTAGESSLRNPQPLACTLSEMSIGLLWTYFRDISTCQFRD